MSDQKNTPEGGGAGGFEGSGSRITQAALVADRAAGRGGRRRGRMALGSGLTGRPVRARQGTCASRGRYPTRTGPRAPTPSPRSSTSWC